MSPSDGAAYPGRGNSPGTSPSAFSEVAVNLSPVGLPLSGASRRVQPWIGKCVCSRSGAVFHHPDATALVRWLAQLSFRVSKKWKSLTSPSLSVREGAQTPSHTTLTPAAAQSRREGRNLDRIYSESRCHRGGTSTAKPKFYTESGVVPLFQVFCVSKAIYSIGYAKSDPCVML